MMKRLAAIFGGLLLTMLAIPSPAGTSVQLTLDWKPEPEFGGFYAGQLSGAFAKQGLDITLKPAGEGAATWQLVATGKIRHSLVVVALYHFELWQRGLAGHQTPSVS